MASDISSAVEGLEIERRSVAEATAGLGATAVLFEDFGARDDDAQQAYLAEVASCDVYVGILGTRYGRLLATRRSATHEEYREAESRGLRICVWTRSDCVWDGDQQVFVDEVRTFHVTNGFADATDLAGRVGRRLAQLAAEDLSPWCKLGRVILRADRISSTSAHVEIAARVKDHDVLAALQAMHPPPGHYERPFEGWGTWSLGSRPVRVKDVVVTHTGSSDAEVQIRLDVIEAPGRSSLVGVGTSGHGPDDLTEIAVRHALFGEALPSGLMSALVEMQDPLAPVRELRLVA